VTGANMPPATHDAPERGCGSTNVTAAPSNANRPAIAAPITPAPTTATVVRIVCISTLPAPA